MRQFVPHVRAFFERDRLAREIDYRVLVVEQEAGLPFNAGLIRNAGFTAGAGASEYTCFNDVDYLPVWADYGWCDVPTRIVWFGAETRPVAPGESNVMLKHDMERFLGGVLIVPNESFAKVDGYSNEYWGWGYEDHDLRERFLRARIVPQHKRGTFLALAHRNAGYDAEGRMNEIAHVNRALFERKCADIGERRDGLSTNAFEVLDRGRIPDAPDVERDAIWERMLIRPRLAPSDGQLAACGLAASH